MQLGDNITIGPYDIGTVCRVEHAKDGMSAFVISSPSEITILFKGSYGIKKVHRRLGVMNGLKRISLFEGDAITGKTHSESVKDGKHVLNHVINQFRGSRFYIYGHSLGSINAQFALANCTHPEAIAAAYLYEGTNIWLLLTPKERRRVAQMRERVLTTWTFMIR